jgi:hypothetical protein
MLERTESNSTSKRGRRSLAVTGSRLEIERQATKHTVRARLRIRIRGIQMVLGLLGPDPLVRDPDP